MEAQVSPVANRVAPESWQGDEMIPTKTYPLSAITGEELTDKERIVELADAFNRVCAENADFVVQSNADENRIAELEAQADAMEEFLGAVARHEQRLKVVEADNAKLKAAMNKYSEDEMLLKGAERLVIAVTALESIYVDTQERFIRAVAKEALAQIESK